MTDRAGLIAQVADLLDLRVRTYINRSKQPRQRPHLLAAAEEVVATVEALMHVRVAASGAAVPADFDPPEWATHEFLTTVSLDAKMAARVRGESGALPPSWTMIDAVINWWEKAGRERWLMADPLSSEQGGPP